ncbi:MAG: sugar phosphate isomerase/epimerase family protein [Thermoguttaceae bacterium]
MKFALCNETFDLWFSEQQFSFEKVFEYVHKLGYDGIEIAPYTIAPNVLEISAKKRLNIRQLSDSFGLEITGLHWLLAKTDGYYLTSPDPIVRQKTADYFLNLIRLCADLGGKVMVLGSPKQRNLLQGVSLEDAYNYATDVLQQLIPMLQKTGVKIAIEPLSPKETDFLTTASETVQLIEQIGAPEQIALHLDCKAMSSETLSIPELIRRNRKELIYFHANDPNLQGPGFGDLKFEPIAEALREIDYDGWISVEVFDYTPGIERLAKDSLTYLHRIFGQ